MPRCNKKSYRQQVLLYGNGAPQWVYIHAIVTQAFLGDRAAGFVVNHKDGNPSNNRLDNLEYVTRIENHQHASKNGLLAFGERNGASKLTAADIPIIRMAIAAGRSDPSIAADYHVCPESIRKIRLGRTWGHVIKPA